MASLFFSYSHQDEALRNQLDVQLAMLKRQGVIDTWHDRRIVAGENLNNAISHHVENDDIILLLVSPDFLASDYCYDVEMQRAMERHDAGEAVVIPVILRPCDWHGAPFGELMATPTDGKPVTMMPDRDAAFLEVTRAIRTATEKHIAQATRSPAPVATSPEFTTSPVLSNRDAPRSSNLAIAKNFTERDRDAFLHEAFEYIAKFFENSLSELAARNSNLEGNFRRVDANRFFATLYNGGKAVERCTIYMGGMFGKGIQLVQGETLDSSSANEMINVDADDQACFLKTMGLGIQGGRDAKLSLEGAAEHLWAIFIRPLQRG